MNGVELTIDECMIADGMTEISFVPDQRGNFAFDRSDIYPFAICCLLKKVL